MLVEKIERCEHRATVREHPACFSGGKSWWADKKIGYMDIETSNLKADFGIILSWMIKGSNGIIVGDFTTKNDELDKRVTVSLVDEMRKYEVLVTYYGSQFDVPFTRTRAFTHQLSFPEYGRIIHWDLYFMARSLFSLTSRRQNKLATLMFGKSEKTRWGREIWARAMRGEEAALEYLVDHNKHDVIELEKLHKALLPYFKPTRRSI